MIKGRINKVAFADGRIKQAYFALKSTRFEEKRLAEFIDRAISDLRQDPF